MPRYLPRPADSVETLSFAPEITHFASRGLDIASVIYMTQEALNGLSANIGVAVRQSQALKLKILVVDDDEEVLAVTTALLEEDGHDVLSAGSARDALRHLDMNRDIALLFTDIVLPGPMDGFDLAETAKVTRPGLRVIYTSGYLKNEGVWAGSLLPKPWTRDDLKMAIADVCGPVPARETPGTVAGSSAGAPRPSLH